MNHPVLFYDGTCPMCHYAVIYFLRVDKNEVLRYGELEGNYALSAIPNYNEIIALDTVAFMTKEGEMYIQSAAILMALKSIPGQKWLGVLLGLIPRFIRDFIYRIIANNRKRLFGACPLIPSKYQHLFLK